MTVRSHSFKYEVSLLILTAISSTKIQGKKSIYNIFCKICTLIQFNILINHKKSYLKFIYKSLTVETLLPNIRLKQGGMSPQNK